MKLCEWCGKREIYEYQMMCDSCWEIESNKADIEKILRGPRARRLIDSIEAKIDQVIKRQKEETHEL